MSSLGLAQKLVSLESPTLCFTKNGVVLPKLIPKKSMGKNGNYPSVEGKLEDLVSDILN